ncbi:MULTISPECIES: hypothetical protein [Metallosphaera]|uniref:hypothetical protein n=1 Tax=Metallosphaera TaxID=41980 RepID=UPI001F05EDC8|nr:hypothetical protein [Metallosphaera sedula]MCH1771219.1 hypothetical protein [Metallosphaera sedula]MCP6729591.1 hypothetical protein [Metallosphaera sedula]
MKIKGSKKVEKVDWIIAMMPATLLNRVGQVIGGKIDVYTNLALLLHSYQYNDPDSQGILSPYLTEESAKYDIITLLRVIDELLKEKGFS